MYAEKGNSKENKNRAVASSMPQKKNHLNPLFGFVDNRIETKSLNAFQRKIHGATQTGGYMRPGLQGLIQQKIRSPNRIPLAIQRVIQLFDAGEGGKWHIHYEHIKLGNNQDSRVNFNDRSKKEIRKELGEKIDRYGLNVGGDLETSFKACIKYINDNY